jgi:hypothetical protein
MATGRRAANDPRGRFDFTGAMTGYSVADFMLGLPRTVITPADQIQGHVGGWRNGFFVNDVWQPARNLTLSLGLRYELNTPVQTYAGLATMLSEDFETIIPSTLPSKGFKFHEPNKKDFAPRLGATYRIGEKTVVRAGYGIYYNPNQMNTFTFLTNNPPLAAASTYTSDPPIRRCPSRTRLGVRVTGRPRISPARTAMPARTGELRHPARAGWAWRSTSSTGSNPEPDAASSTTRRSRVPERWIPAGPARTTEAGASSRTISWRTTTRLASSSPSG